MSGYIMDHFITRERAKTLIVFSKVYVFPPAFSGYLCEALQVQNDTTELSVVGACD